MSTILIGGGIAGLAAAIKIKLKHPREQVTIIDRPNSNSQISGQRYRQRVAHMTGGNDAAVLDILKQKTGGNVTEGMRLIASKGDEELEFWQTLEVSSLTKSKVIGNLPYAENPHWFGPKFGGNVPNAGRVAIDWFRSLANAMGVDLINSAVKDIEIIQDEIVGLIAENKDGTSRYRASNYIFAGGNPGGAMFNSTNKRILNTPQELLVSKGLGIVGAHSFMLHPFGRAKIDGIPLMGCYETDALAGHEVYIGDGQGDFPYRDIETEELLRSHKAHYEFEGIMKRFTHNGGLVRLKHPDQDSYHYARVAHHYSQIGIATTENYVSVQGLNNAHAIGDTATINRYTGGSVRIPGLALTACLVDADIVSNVLVTDTTHIKSEVVHGYSEKSQLSDYDNQTLRDINTKYLLHTVMGEVDRVEEWQEQLNQLRGDSGLLYLSRITSTAVNDYLEGSEDMEARIYYLDDRKKRVHSESMVESKL